MTTPTSDDPFPPQRDGTQGPPPAYADQATFEIDKPINLAQLASEIQQGVRKQVNVAQLGPQDQAAPISADNKVEIAVSPGSVNADTVNQVIADHEPQEGWGVPTYIRDFDALLLRVANEPDETLSGDDLELAVRGLLLWESARRASGSTI